MKKFCSYALAAMLCSAPVIAQTQSDQPRTLTLDQALAIAFERNVTIAQTANGIESAQAGVRTAYGSYIPKLSAGASYDRTGRSIPSGQYLDFRGIQQTYPQTTQWTNTFQGGVGLTYTLFDGFNRESNFSTAQANSSSAKETYERTRQSIADAVSSAYLLVLQNEQQVKVFQENLNNEKNRLDRITEQNRLGAVAIGDVYRQQSVVAQAEYNLISGQNLYDKSKTDLQNLLALDVNQDIVIADPSIAAQIKDVESDPGVQALGPYSDLLRRALDSRLDYMVAKDNVTISDNGITQAWSRYYPTLNANASYQTTSPDLATVNDKWAYNLGLGLSWQLPEIFGSMQQIQIADISKKNAVLQLQQKERDISVELKKALLDLEAARKQYVASQKSQIAAEQDRKTAEAKYNLGSGTLLDLQVANTTFLNAQLTTLFNAYNFISLKKNLDLVLGEKKY